MSGRMGSMTTRTTTGSRSTSPSPYYVNVTLEPGAAASTWYFNVSVDIDRDGEWRDEWFVRNEALNHHMGGEVRLDIPPPFPA